MELGEPIQHWPYLPTMMRLALALALGLFVGIERERRRKEAGLRTFGFIALLGGVGGLLGQPYSVLALLLVGVMVVLLNVETIRTGEGAEITTSAALLLIAFAGLLAGEGHTFTPTILGITSAGLLAWKEPMAGFTQTLTEAEVRSAVLLAILTFVVLPVLPRESVDRWDLVAPREAWVTVILIGALGFVNYVLLKRYGAKGIVFTGFLGGLVNSTVTVTELSNRASSAPKLIPVVYRGVVLATAAMLLRNAIILGLLAPSALVGSALALTAMFAATVFVAFFRRSSDSGVAAEGLIERLESPFSLAAALKFGAMFLVLQVVATLAQRSFGNAGFYAVSVVGGVVSSASAVASAAALAASGALTAKVAGAGAVLAAISSALVNVPLVARIGHDGWLTRRVLATLLGIALIGAAGEAIQVGLFR